ncbi:MAG: SUF system NifU family Fe-S cluster assembly protein [Candidatus Kerfeldbacteria bacterium]|nr:SUF system NifU family Fe-S cluster assembly protein [Candidatus Kerfeldbacteria bacterium]
MDSSRELILDHMKHPRNYGALADATHIQNEVNPACGDEMKVYVKISGDVIKDISYEGQGCSFSMAGGSLLTEHVKGKRVKEVSGMSEDDMLALFRGPVSPARLKCALLAYGTLRKILSE